MLLCPEAWSAKLAKRWALGSFGAGPGSGKRRVQLRRCWMMSVLGDARKGMRPGGTWPGSSLIRQFFSCFFLLQELILSDQCLNLKTAFYKQITNADS